jgi:hypothetical protein
MAEKIVYVENSTTGQGPVPWFVSKLAVAKKKGFTVCDPQPKEASPAHASDVPVKAAGEVNAGEASVLSGIASGKKAPAALKKTSTATSVPVTEKKTGE